MLIIYIFTILHPPKFQTKFQAINGHRTHIGPRITQEQRTIKLEFRNCYSQPYFTLPIPRFLKKVGKDLTALQPFPQTPFSFSHHLFPFPNYICTASHPCFSFFILPPPHFFFFFRFNGIVIMLCIQLRMYIFFR